MITRDRVRLSRRVRWLVALAAAIAAGGGAAVFALPAHADQATFACAPTPQPPAPSSSATDSASPSAGPTALCVSVLANQSSVTSGSTVQYAVSVWTQGPGTLPGVGLWLTTDASGVGATFTSCPSGAGTSSCVIGTLGTPGGAPSPYELEAQVQVPSATTISSLTMFAMASASTTPSMGSYPQAGQPVSVTSPSPSASPSSSASASPSPSGSSSSASAGQTANPASAATKPAPGTTGLPASPVSVGATAPFSLPAAPVPVVQPGSGSTASTVSGQFPVIAPGPYVSTSSTPVANTEPLPGAPNTSSGLADPSRFTLNIGMSANTAMALALVTLALAIVFAATRIGRRRTKRHSAAAVAAVATASGASGGGATGGAAAGGGDQTRIFRRRSGLSRWLPFAGAGPSGGAGRSRGASPSGSSRSHRRSGIGPDLAGPDLPASDRTGSDLTGAKLPDPDLTGSDLTGSDLTGAKLPGPDLPGPNVPGADLPRTDLPGADMLSLSESSLPSLPPRLAQARSHDCDNQPAIGGWLSQSCALGLDNRWGQIVRNVHKGPVLPSLGTPAHRDRAHSDTHGSHRAGCANGRVRCRRWGCPPAAAPGAGAGWARRARSGRPGPG